MKCNQNGLECGLKFKESCYKFASAQYVPQMGVPYYYQLYIMYMYIYNEQIVNQIANQQFCSDPQKK